MKFFNYPYVLHGDKKLIDQIFGLLDEAGRNNDKKWNEHTKESTNCVYLYIEKENVQYHNHNCRSATKNLITLTEANLSEIIQQLQLNTTSYEIY